MNYHQVNRDLKMIMDDQDTSSAYQAWLDHPMTQRVIGILTVLGQPAGLPDRTEVGAMMHADTVGWVRCLNKMQMLNVQPGNDVEADFGADDSERG